MFSHARVMVIGVGSDVKVLSMLYCLYTFMTGCKIFAESLLRVRIVFSSHCQCFTAYLMSYCLGTHIYRLSACVLGVMAAMEV